MFGDFYRKDPFECDDKSCRISQDRGASFSTTVGEIMKETHRLLREYRENRSETAFEELVNRYIDLVYSVALRRVSGDVHRAHDVVQSVFTDLARKAQDLPGDVMLGGWLHRHSCFVASNLSAEASISPLRREPGKGGYG